MGRDDPQEGKRPERVEPRQHLVNPQRTQDEASKKLTERAGPLVLAEEEDARMMLKQRVAEWILGQDPVLAEGGVVNLINTALPLSNSSITSQSSDSNE